MAKIFTIENCCKITEKSEEPTFLYNPYNILYFFRRHKSQSPPQSLQRVLDVLGALRTSY